MYCGSHVLLSLCLVSNNNNSIAVMSETSPNILVNHSLIEVIITCTPSPDY